MHALPHEFCGSEGLDKDDAPGTTMPACVADELLPLRLTIGAISPSRDSRLGAWSKRVEARKDKQLVDLN